MCGYAAGRGAAASINPLSSPFYHLSQRVPLRRLFEYEEALFRALSAPRAASAAESAGAPSSLPGSLLGAALACPVTRCMQDGAARLDMTALLRGASAHLNKTAREASEAQAASRAAAVAAAPPPPRPQRSGSLWNWLAPPPSPASPAEPAAAITSAMPLRATPAEDPELAAARAAEAAFDRAAHYVRLDPGTPLGALPRPWRLLHVAVADFTRRFCDEPLPHE